MNKDKIVLVVIAAVCFAGAFYTLSNMPLWMAIGAVAFYPGIQVYQAIQARNN